jgi:hypothetical protein
LSIKQIKLPGVIPTGIVRGSDDSGTYIIIGVLIPKAAAEVSSAFLADCREVFDRALRMGLAYELTKRDDHKTGATTPDLIQ